MPNVASRDQKKFLDTPPSKLGAQDPGIEDSTQGKSGNISMNPGLPKRANTLSWQQRPPRNDTVGTRSRPQSGLINQSTFTPPAQEAAALPGEGTEDFSRDNISKTLAQKDPAWFKQTQDRRTSSAAYRKTPETEVKQSSSPSERRVLPGMGQDTIHAPQNISPPPQKIRPESTSRLNEKEQSGENQSTDLSTFSSIPHSLTNPSLQDIRLPPPSSVGLVSREAVGRGSAPIASQGRVSPERTQRTPSPTKGLGGFVQSAMLKRSDSVNKRWSAQGTPGLSRGNSIASVRSSKNATQYVGNYRAPADSRPGSISRENSPAPTSRPTSSHASTLQHEVLPPSSENKAVADRQPAIDNTEVLSSAKSNGHHPSPSDSLPASSSLPTLTSPPSSPSKRWSPTKSSWLGNAINKPESPKPKFSVPQQPSWMADLNRLKQQKADAEPLRERSPHKVNTTGFLRSPPMGGSNKNSSISGLPLGFSAGVNARETPKQTTTESVDHIVPDDHFESTNSQGIQPMEGSEQSAKPDQHGPGSSISKYQDPTSPPTDRRSVTPSTSPRPIGLLKSYSVTPPRQSSTTSPGLSKTVNPASGAEEAEFKNVFGKLRRTQTKNYVAPNELKDNIVRGKAGLNFTGGPKKTERIDEFKESILKKKQEMKESQGRHVPGKPAPFREPKSMPLRFNHGQALSRESSSDLREDLSVATKAQLLEAAPKLVAESSPAEVRRPVETESYTAESPATADNSKGKALLVASTAVSKNPQEGLLPLKPSVRPQPESATPKTQAKLGSSFSSSLASLIARRPPPMNPDTDELSPQNVQSKVPIAEIEPQTSGKQLEHVIKSRAKGPKRRAPTSKASDTLPSKEQAKIISTTTNDSLPKPFAKPLAAAPPAFDGSELRAGKSEKVYGLGIDTQEVSVKDPPVQQSKPEIQVPSPSIRSPILPSSGERRTENDDRVPRSLPSPNIRVSSPAPPKSPFMRTVAPRSSTSSKTSSHHIPKPMSPSLPTKSSTLSQSPISPEHTEPMTSAKPPSSSQSPVSLVDRLPSDKPVRALLAVHLASPTSSTTTIPIDTPSIISQLSSSPKIETLQKSISELGAHGTIHPLPQGLEHILFSAHLYLCTHVFSTPNGTRTTEVYIWHGFDVPPAQVEDAQLFARRAAKDAGGKLIIMKQGRETAEFLQALGGILITRRGFSSRSTSPVKASATYMLRGRRYMGQITFDEVNLSIDELCSGFPHLISAPFGKLYLWKGFGAGADELGCARLIGMDLGLTGEIEECDEQEESAAFWDAFPSRFHPLRTSNTAGNAADRWKAKATCESYTTRLFSVDLETPRPKSSASSNAVVVGFGRWVRQGSIPNISSPTPESEAKNPVAHIREISPFAQDDLVAGGVYVLDAFFEAFV